MEFTEEEKRDLRMLMDESHSNFVFRTNVEEYFAEILKESIFESYDGVKMYEGDKYWYLSERDSIMEGTVYSDSDYDKRRFSTLQAAQEYVYKYVGEYSKNDILIAVNHWSKHEISLQDIDRLLKPF